MIESTCVGWLHVFLSRPLIGFHCRHNEKKKLIFFYGFPFNFSAPPQPYLVPLVVKPRRPLQHLLIFLFEPTSSLPTSFLQRPATTYDFLLRLSLGKKHDYISLLQFLLVVYLFWNFLKNFYFYFFLGFGYLPVV